MASDLTLKELFEQYFNPREDFKTYFSKESSFMEDGVILQTKQLSRIFKSGAVKGDTLITLGHSFLVHLLLPASGAFKVIIAADHLDRNIQELKKWLSNDPDALDWTEAAKLLCEVEGDSEHWKEKQERLRRSVQQVVKCDVMESNPLAPVSLPQADCVFVFWYLETICLDMDSYLTALKNISSLLKPGGHLVMMSALGCTFYLVSEYKFPYLCLDEENVRQALSDAGYVIEELQVVPRILHGLYTTIDFTDQVYIVARKERADQ